jgi:AcrR family transcriptional regulator
VQDRAGVSRGAVMHHFATREDIIVETLTRILGGTRRGQGLAGRIGGVSVERDLMALWSDMVDRPEGRAMVEILVAARTDPALGVRIAPLLADYDAGIGRDVLRVYAATSGDDGDVIGIWTICRVFLRSLHLQRRFDPDPDAVRASLRRFAGLVAPHLRRRAP